MSFEFSIPTNKSPKNFHLETGQSIFFLGANGGGKTRLAVLIEKTLGEQAHRIAAHRALSLNAGVPKIQEGEAYKILRFGTGGEHGHLQLREFNRWGRNESTSLLSDFDPLMQVLFAQQNNITFKSHNSGFKIQDTKFEILKKIWERVLPHRSIIISGDDIAVKSKTVGEQYSASQMSDGERAVFYLAGQVLVAKQNSVLIFDEPELHIHRAILSKLWDELEAARPDCAFIVISHDLEFVASRNEQKYAIRDYLPSEGWTIEDVSQDSGFSEEITTLILGSRQPILFVEGDENSLDKAIYRACFPNWTVVPRGSCDEVKHAVATFRANTALTRIKCAGIVDADGHRQQEINDLKSKGIHVLPVSEIENLFLLPNVVTAILTIEGHSGNALTTKATEITNILLEEATKTEFQLACVQRYCQRHIDRVLKRVEIAKASDADALANDYVAKTGELDVKAVWQEAVDSICMAISNRDVPKLLQWIDNKGLIRIAARTKNMKQNDFAAWVLRAIGNQDDTRLKDALKPYLPDVVAI